MEQLLPKHQSANFHRLKIEKKQQLTKTTFLLQLQVPEELKDIFRFEAGQYVTINYKHEGKDYYNDFSMVSAPHEEKIVLGVKVHSEHSSSHSLIHKHEAGDFLKVSVPSGRFTLQSKPSEFRTIVAFAAGIGITPVLSHIKDILHEEARTRIFLFYGNVNRDETAFYDELQQLVKEHHTRLQVHYFFSREFTGNGLHDGRIDSKKVKLIINQILNYDDTDEESTIWDSVDEVLICGPGEMIKEVANACYQHGIPKKNIHFELFEEYNEDIFPVEVQFPEVENVLVKYRYNSEDYSLCMESNRNKILQTLLQAKLPVPYSCKSGICGTCICKLKSGDVELIENEYLTDKEIAEGKILACMAFALTETIELDFDLG